MDTIFRLRHIGWKNFILNCKLKIFIDNLLWTTKLLSKVKELDYLC
jgi:hypothetical protein